MTPLFIFWGYGSEDVTGPLRAYARAQGANCIALPQSGRDAASELELISSTPYVLITSCHFARDSLTMRDVYPEVAIGCSPLEMIGLSKPLLSIFYPHDPATLLVLNEPQLLGAFDLVLWPTDSFGYQPVPGDIEHVGWIGKHLGAGDFAAAERVFFFSDFVHHHRTFGMDGTYEKLKPVLDCGVWIKFPLWPGHAEYETFFADRGAQVLEAHYSTYAIAQQAELVISNGLSGISIEANWAGTPVVNLIEPWIPERRQREMLLGLDGCVVCSYADAPAHILQPPAAPKQNVQDMDLGHIWNLIRSRLENR